MRREDRLSWATKEFKAANLTYEIIEAVDGSLIESDRVDIDRGNMGCTLSHLKALKLAKERNLRNILICEDDIDFIQGIQQKFNDMINQLPVWWDVLYLGYNPVPFRQPMLLDFSRNLKRANSVLTTHCIGVNARMYQDLITKIETDTNRPIDVHHHDIQPYYNYFAVDPMLAFQRAGHSDIENKDVNYQK